MDKTDLLISLIDRASTLYDDIVNSEELDPVELERAIEYLQLFNEELEALVD